MAKRLNSSDKTFDADFAAFVAAARADEDDVRDVVSEIIAAVRERGFAAIHHYTKEFDRFEVTHDTVRLNASDLKRAYEAISPQLRADLELAAKRIRAYHEQQMPEDKEWRDDESVLAGWRWNAVDAAGLYAPGGRAAYPSSVLMNAIPAKVAGVKRLCLCVPTPKGETNDAVLAAAYIAGVDAVYRVGGAQAIAAMAYGAAPIAPVDVIVGPGNAYVAEAKRQVFGQVGIDSVAGPSEILVVADGKNDPAWIAADLLSQAEHDPSSQSVLITDDVKFADAVEAAVVDQLEKSAKREIASAAWRDNSAIMVVERLDQAPALVNALAPEHLELAIDDPDALLGDIRHAGAIFIGRHAPEALGDYLAGPNHVLPTSGAARYASGLSVLNFMKRTSIIGADADAIRRVGPAAARLADAEGLPSHAASVRARLPKS